MTYRELKKDLNALFDNVDHSTMDNQVAPEDLEAIGYMIETIKYKSEKQSDAFIY